MYEINYAKDIFDYSSSRAALHWHKKDPAKNSWIRVQAFGLSGTDPARRPDHISPSSFFALVLCVSSVSLVPDHHAGDAIGFCMVSAV